MRKGKSGKGSVGVGEMKWCKNEMTVTFSLAMKSCLINLCYKLIKLSNHQPDMLKQPRKNTGVPARTISTYVQHGETFGYKLH